MKILICGLILLCLLSSRYAFRIERQAVAVTEALEVEPTDPPDTEGLSIVSPPALPTTAAVVVPPVITPQLTYAVDQVVVLGSGGPDGPSAPNIVSVEGQQLITINQGPQANPVPPPPRDAAPLGSLDPAVALSRWPSLNTAYVGGIRTTVTTARPNVVAIDVGVMGQGTAPTTPLPTAPANEAVEYEQTEGTGAVVTATTTSVVPAGISENHLAATSPNIAVVLPTTIPSVNSVNVVPATTQSLTNRNVVPAQTYIPTTPPPPTIATEPADIEPTEAPEIEPTPPPEVTPIASIAPPLVVPPVAPQSAPPVLGIAV